MKLLIAHIFAIFALTAAVELDPAVVLGVVTPTTHVTPDGVDKPMATTRVPDVVVVQDKENTPVPLTPVSETTVVLSDVKVPDVTVPPPMPPVVVLGVVTPKPDVGQNPVPSVTVGTVPSPVVVVTTQKPAVMNVVPIANSDVNSEQVMAQKPAPVPTTIV